MMKGWKVFGCVALALGVMLLTADAQPPAKGSESVAVLEAQLALLQKMTAEVEAKLKAAKGDEPKRGFGQGFGRGGFGKMEEKMKGAFGKLKGQFGGKKGKGEKKERDRDPNRSVEERLDRLAKEIEEIRKSLKK